MRLAWLVNSPTDGCAERRIDNSGDCQSWEWNHIEMYFGEMRRDKGDEAHEWMDIVCMYIYIRETY